MTELPAPIVPPRLWREPEKHFHGMIDSPWYQLVTILESFVLTSTQTFYASRGIVPVPMPITSQSISSPMGLGSDSIPVEIELHSKRIHLADSMQFQLELLLRHNLRGAYYVMPTFRGEDPDETHLNQFFHSEAEIRGGLDDVIELVDAYVLTMAKEIATGDLRDSVVAAAGTADHLEDMAGLKRFPRITFDAAQEYLPADHFEEVRPGVLSITREGEQALIRDLGPVWLTHPPAASVPFYQRTDERGRAECADLLLGIGEIVGCGERHSTGAAVRESLASHQVDPAEYAWYIAMKDTWPLRTAGFGLGIERFLLWVLQHDDIRDLHALPRLKGVDSWA